MAGAKVDVWHASSEGFYENQDPEQADMNLRGQFTTDASGHILNPGMPFGNYKVCAASTGLGRKTASLPVVVNNTLNGTTVNLTLSLLGALNPVNFSC